MKTMLELFLKYGIASLFGVTRFLHDENERLRVRVWQLENRANESRYEPSGYEDLDESDDKNWDVGWYDDRSTNQEPRDEVFGRTAATKNLRRTVDDLVKEAKQKHETQYSNRAFEEAIERERLIEEMSQKDPDEIEVPVEVKLSDAKKNFVIESGKAIMQTPEQ